MRKPFPAVPVHFILAAASLTLVSYAGFPPIVRVTLFTVGFLLPLVQACRADTTLRTPGTKASTAVFALILLGAAAVRMAGLTSWPGWPTPDEGTVAHWAAEIAAGAPLRLWYGYYDSPPLYPWFLGAFLKFLSPSLLSLWLFPALLSFLGAILLWIALRIFRVPSLTSALCLAFYAFSFWPIQTARFSESSVLMMIWVFPIVIGIGLLLRTRRPGFRLAGSALLGAFTAAGLYTYQPWPAAAVLFTLWVLLALPLQVPSCSRTRVAAAYLAPFLLVAWPYLAALAGDANTSRFHSSSIFQPGLAWNTVLERMAWVPAFLFGGGTHRPLIYGPVHGGLLNPVLGALWALGAAVLWRTRKTPSSRVLIMAQCLLVLPGLLSYEGNSQRLVFLIPWLLHTSAIGTVSLISTLPRIRPALLLILLFIPAAAMDAAHWMEWHRWFGVPGHHWPLYKSAERLRAYQSLRSWSNEHGRGWVLADLAPRITDRTLSFAARPFETREGETPRWCAVLANLDYRPFLESRFPSCVTRPLANDLTPEDGGLALFIVPFEPDAEKALRTWKAAQDRLQGYVSGLMQRRLQGTQEPQLRALFGIKESFVGDPFLASLFWEKVLYHYNSDRHLPGALWAARQAVEKGYPAAHLLNELGVLSYRSGERAKAINAFRRALRSPLNLTPAAGNLERLESEGKP